MVILNINNKAGEGMEDSGLYFSGKSCYVMARFSLEASRFDFFVPGFLLMQQSLENLIKACLRVKKIKWATGNEGHNFRKLINLSNNIDFIKNKIANRDDFLVLLDELGSGYNTQRYGEAGHFIYGYEKMMDLFDEMVYILVMGYVTLIEPRRDQASFERFVALPVPDYIGGVFKRKLKQPFNFCFYDYLSIK